MAASDEITKYFISQLMQTPLFMQKVDEKISERTSEILSDPKVYTEAEMAKLYQVSKATIMRMSDSQIERLGYIREKVGVKSRYRRIRYIETNIK